MEELSNPALQPRKEEKWPHDMTESWELHSFAQRSQDVHSNEVIA
jgi:hypothetical protein